MKHLCYSKLFTLLFLLSSSLLASERYAFIYSKNIDDRFINLLEGTQFATAAGFIPAGVIHDLIDNNTSPIVGATEHTAVTSDVISGYSHSTIFGRLNSGVLSPAGIKIPLSGVAPSGVTIGQINGLFGNYGY